MKPSEFQDLALCLLKSIDTYRSEMIEGISRSIIDRYYYFYFLTARELLMSNGVKLSKGPNVHKQVEKYIQDSLKDFDVCKTELASLRFKRNQASYVLEETFTSNDANDYILKIDLILSKLQQAMKKGL